MPSVSPRPTGSGSPSCQAFVEQIAVAEHRALGAAGGAGGVDEGGELVGRQTRPARPTLPRPRSGAARSGSPATISSRSAGSWSRCSSRPAAASALAITQRRFRVGEDADRLARGQGRVDRVEDRAEPEDPPPDLEIVGAVGQDHADHVALPHSALTQARGDLGHAGGELAVGPLLMGVADEALVADLDGARGQQLGQGAEVGRQGPGHQDSLSHREGAGARGWDAGACADSKRTGGFCSGGFGERGWGSLVLAGFFARTLG